MLFVRSDFKLRSFESHLFLSLAAGDVALLCSRFQRTDSTMMIVPSQKVSENNRMFLGDRANITAFPVVHPTKQHSITRRHSNVLLVVTLLLLFSNQRLLYYSSEESATRWDKQSLHRNGISTESVTLQRRDI